MNKKLLIGGGVLAAFLLLGGKKSSVAPKSQHDDIYEGDEGDENISEPEPEPKTEPSQASQQQDPDLWKKLSASRRKLADLWISDKPTDTPITNIWYGLYGGDYSDWVEGNAYNDNNYYHWLTNQIYWDITVNKEDTTDLFGKTEKYSATYPFSLARGEVANYDSEDGVIYYEKFDESQSAANKRLAKGIALWLQIRSYIKHKLKPSNCPAGVVCK